MESICWYALRTRPRHEKKVRDFLQLRDFEVFLPVFHERKRWKNRTTVNLENPLFPGYLFVHTDVPNKVEILGSAGVLWVVRSGNSPAPVPQYDIEILKSRITDLRPEPCPYIKAGDKVRVKRGPLAGLEGILLYKKENFRFVLSMDLIQQSVAVDVDASDLDCVLPKRIQLPN